MKILYETKEFGYKDLKSKNLVIPKIERGLIWTEDRKKQFIKNTLNGFPFGSILVKKTSTNKYVVIDGIQRINTLKDYMHDINNYVTYACIDESEEIIPKIVDKSEKNYGHPNSKSEHQLEKLYNKIRKTIFNYRDCKTNDIIKLLSERCYLDIVGCKNELTTLINDFKDYINIENIKIPAILFTGNEENLADIFYEINQSGIKFSKYDIYSSCWNNIIYDIHDEDLVEAVIYRYDKILRNNKYINLEYYDNGVNGINLFEYCCALGDIIQNRCSCLFDKSSKVNDYIGFDLISLLLGVNANDADKIKKKLMNATPEFLINLKNCILESALNVDDILNKWLIMADGSYLVTKNTNMIYHIILSYIHNVFIIDFKNNKVEKKNTLSVRHWRGNFALYMPLHFLNDTISFYWDKNKRRSDLLKLVNDKKSLNKYAFKVDREIWENNVNDFLKNEPDIDKEGISYETKLLVAYLFKYKMHTVVEMKDEFDILEYTSDVLTLTYTEFIRDKFNMLKKDLFNYLEDLYF